MKRRLQPNAKYKCRFYKYGVETKNQDITTTSYGEIRNEFSLFTTGLFAKELPFKPSEIEEGSRTVAEQKFMLIGRWTRSLNLVTHGMFCYILADKKLYAVEGNATDKLGNKQNIYITIIDNVTQNIASQFPGSPI